MNLNHTLRGLAVLSLAAVSAATLAAGSDTFATGQSFYGQPSGDSAGARVVQVGSVQTLNVRYGETVAFSSAGQQFAWTFDGLDNRAVDLAKIAPSGFAAKPLTVYVGKNPMNRR